MRGEDAAQGRRRHGDHAGNPFPLFYLAPFLVLDRPRRLSRSLRMSGAFNCDRSHWTRAPSVASGGRVGGLLATVDSEEAVPSPSDFRHAVYPRRGPAKVSSPSHERIQLLEFARDRHFPQLLPHYSFDGLPAPSKSPSLRFCNRAPHLLPAFIIPLS